MESENYYHKNSLGAVTARLSVFREEGLLLHSFMARHEAAVRAFFESAAAPMADAAYSEKILKKPLILEVVYRLGDEKYPCLCICETVRAGRRVIYRTEEKHRFFSFCGRLFYRGGKAALRTQNPRIETKIINRNT